MITLMFDDAIESEYTKVYPLLKNKGVVACTAVVADWVGTPGHMSLEQLLELQGAGWEILGHTKTHPSDLTTLSENAILHELTASKILLANMGLKVESLIYPAHKYNDLTKAVASRYYRSARGKVSEPPTWNIRNSVNLFELESVHMEQHRHWEMFKEVIAQHGEENWLILYWHMLQFQTQSSGTWKTRSTVEEKLWLLEAAIDYAKVIKTPIVTCSQALTRMGV